jgi:hypothetical protein
MSEHGPNVRRLSYLDNFGHIRIRFSEQPDGLWAARADSRAWPDHAEFGADPEEAGGKLIGWLEGINEWVPEPPDDFQKDLTLGS